MVGPLYLSSTCHHSVSFVHLTSIYNHFCISHGTSTPCQNEWCCRAYGDRQHSPKGTTSSLILYWISSPSQGLHSHGHTMISYTSAAPSPTTRLYNHRLIWNRYSCFLHNSLVGVIELGLCNLFFFHHSNGNDTVETIIIAKNSFLVLFRTWFMLSCW